MGGADAATSGGRSVLNSVSAAGLITAVYSTVPEPSGRIVINTFVVKHPESAVHSRSGVNRHTRRSTD